MASRFGNNNQPDLDRLQHVLLTSGLQTKDNALYQVIFQLIQATRAIQTIINSTINNSDADLAALEALVAALQGLTFLTGTDQTALLPNSRELLPGTNITFDDSVPNERTINASGSGEDGVWTPLSDGDTVEPELIFNSFGECIMVFVPNP